MVYSFRITVIELLLSLKFLSVDQHSRDNEPPWCELALGRKTAFVTNQAFVTLLKKIIGIILYIEVVFLIYVFP